MASWEPTETRTISVTTAGVQLNFEKKCTRVYLQADDLCYVDFDKPADTGSFPIVADVQGLEINAPFTRLYAITADGTANLYVLAVRGQA